MKAKRLFLLLIACLAFSWVQAQTYTPDKYNRIYVDNGKSNGSGNSWNNAVKELDSVLEDVKAYRNKYPDDLEIWVAKGTHVAGFVPEGAENETLDQTFYIPEGVSVYGGFVGTEENIDQRVPGNTTILSGENGPGVYHVVLITKSNVSLDGFTISGGNANGSGSLSVDGVSVSRTKGAGVYIGSGISGITLSNLTITDNTSTNGGASIYNNAVSFSMNNCIVTNNTSTGSCTGGIYLESTGGMTGSVKNTLIYFNATTSTAASIYGTDVFFSASSGNPMNMIIENTTVVSDSSKGAIYTVGSTYLTITLKNSIIASSMTSSPTLGWDNGGTLNCYSSYVQKTTVGNPITPDYSDDNCLSRDIDPYDLFENIASGDFRPKQCSPLINAGNNQYLEIGDKDIAGNNRIIYETVDIGAYEYNGELPQAHTLAWDESSGSLEQNVSLGNPIVDIVLSFGGGAGSATVDGLPDFILTDIDDDANTITIKGTPLDDIGNYVFTVTTVPADGNCATPEVLEGEIVISHKVVPDDNGILYVKKGADGDGSTWADALGELSVALLGSTFHSDVKQIWVGTGTKNQPATFYPEYPIAQSDWEDNNTTDADKTFLLLNGIKIYGGFDPEADIIDLSHQRDSTLTVLSGQLNKSTSAYHVVVALNQSELNNNEEINHIVIDGFTITGGKANGTGGILFPNFANERYFYPIYQNAGAGIFAEAGDGYITINGNHIYGNIAEGESSDEYNSNYYATGAGVCAYGALQITHNKVFDNTVSASMNARGGGIAAFWRTENTSASTPAQKATGSLRSSTETEIGYSYIRNIYIAHNLIDGNLATGDYTSGGGILIAREGSFYNEQGDWQDSYNRVQVLYNTITDNTVDSPNDYSSNTGGGISIGYFRFNRPNSPPTPSGSSRSAAIDRDADYEYYGNIVIAYNLISKNEVDGNGGGIYSNNDYNNESLSTINNVVVKNQASGYGGGMYINYGRDFYSLNNTIWGNTASGDQEDGALGWDFYANNSSYDIRFSNTIVNDVYVESSNALFYNNLVGMVDGGYFNLEDYFQENNDYGNIVGQDPSFEDNDNDDYSLSDTSIAINKGENSEWSNFVYTASNDYTSFVDFVNNQRVFNKVIDMGAFEAQLCPENILVDNNKTTITVTPDENRIVYVKIGGEGEGSSWEDAHPSLADVLAYAYHYPDCIREIWVAEGTHYPEYNPEFEKTDISDNRQKIFLMVGGVNIYGGFPADATSNTNNDKDNIIHRNWNKWKTILSGDLDKNDIVGDDNGDNVDENNNGIPDSKEDNAYTVIISYELSTTTELNGFVITGGYGSGGGGIYIRDTFDNAHNNCNSLYVKNTIITGNYADAGGGIYIYTYANPVFVNVLIAGNIAEQGGGIYKHSPPPTVSSLPTSDETALRSAISSCDATTYTNVTIVGNHSTYSGGGMYIGSGEHWLYNTIVWGNTSASSNEYVNGIAGSSASSMNASNSIVQDYENIQYILFSIIENSVNDTDPEFAGKGNPNLNIYEKYRLSSASTAAIDQGNNDYYYGAVDKENGGLLDDERDLAAVLRIIDGDGDKTATIDIGAYEYRLCPPIVIWLGITNDWQEVSNWYPTQIPQACTDVYIPGIGVLDKDEYTSGEYKFPFLREGKNNVCDRIFFMPGAQLGRPDLLTYNEAFVELDYNGESSTTAPTTIEYEALANKVESFHTTGREVPITSKDRVKFGASYSGITLDRGRWNMLSAPLSGMVTGDFAFGGFPFSYIKQYDAEGGSDSYIKGKWADFSNAAHVPFVAGQGFGHYFFPYKENTPYGMDNSDSDQWQDATDNTGVISAKPKHIKAKTDSDNETEFGLVQSNGILHFPFFDDEYLSDARREHQYEKGISTFNSYWQSPLGSVQFLQWSEGTHTFSRPSNTHRFITEDWGEGGEEYTPAGTFTEGSFVLVGNPYMSALDFEAFYDKNSDKIKNVYQIYRRVGDETYYSYTGESADNPFIAPMQSFLVEVADRKENNETGLSLTFDAKTMAKTNTGTTLKAPAQAEAKNRLKITASNLNGSTTAWMRQSEQGIDGIDNNDFSKIIDSPSSRPEVYTLASTEEGKLRALLMNTVKSNQVSVPIGITTTYSGKIAFSITGMRGYNAKVFFIDVETGTDTEISNQEEFIYSFTHNAQNGYSLENRFYIRFSPGSSTAIDNINPLNNVIAYVNDTDLVIISSEDNLINEVQVYDSQGYLLLKQPFLSESVYKSMGVFDESGVYIIKIHTAQGVKSQKIIK